MLDGKSALVTGATGGLGQGIARSLARAHAKVYFTDVDKDALETSVANLRAEGIDIAGTFAADLTDPEAITALYGEFAESVGDLDILVNNAGMRGDTAPFLDYPFSKWQETIDLNLTAPFLLTQIFARRMVERGGGKIINIASIAGGATAFEKRIAYNSSNAGLVMLTRSVAMELGQFGVYCNAIAPGVIETPLTKHYLADEQVVEHIVRSTPMGRWGQPAEIGEPVVFLASDASSYVNGVTLYVDGGWMTGKSL